MDELIERLRNFKGSDALGNGDFSLLHEAAAALEEARAEVESVTWELLDETHRADKLAEAWNAEYLRAERLAEALRDAEKSLRTIADRAGGTEYLMTIGDVRGYANSRANEARAALAKGNE